MTEKALKPIKPFLNYEEQINNLIEQKGMIVNDHKFAVSKLEDISYFALIDGYKNLFYNPMTRKYKEGTTFEDLVALYEFDEKLRTLIFRYLCHFEQKMRSLWFNEMGGDSWVAISLSDYNKIYNKNESLNKNEIIRIWRKEGSRKSDLSDKQHRKIKSIALGKCGNMDEEGLEYKYNFQIKKEQIKEMIGFSMTGLVIIPDNIFTQAEKESDYKKMFMIINVPKKNLTVSTRYIEEKLQQGKLDEAFCKLTIQGIDKKENVLNQMVVILVAIIILIFTMFITWLMLQNDQEHLKQKYQLGAILGMKRKEGYLSVVKEISRDMWWSLLLAIGISGMFCGVFIKSYYYGTTEIVLIQKEVAMLGCILCIYGIIFMIFIIFSTRRLWKEISKIWGDKN